MMTPNYENIFSNVEIDALDKSQIDPQLRAHWHVLKDLLDLARRVKSQQHSMVLWDFAQEPDPLQAHLFASIRSHAYVVGLVSGRPEQPLSLLRAAQADQLIELAEAPSALDRAALALRPGAWELPVEVRYQPELNELMVSFANGETVAWDVLTLPDFEWERAFVDLKGEPYAVGVFKKNLPQPTFVSGLKIRRDTKTLPAGYVDGMDEQSVQAKSKAYGEFLKARMAEAGMTQDQLAAKMGVSREQLNRVLNGHHFPRLSTLQKMAAALGVERKALLMDQGE